MKMKKMPRSWLPLVVLMVLTLLLAGCNSQQAEETTAPTTEPTVPAEPLAMEQRSLLLASGETAVLTVTGGSEITFASSDPEVASVDASGTVKALKKGNAMITATSGAETVYCGVIVDGIGEMVDVSKMEANAVFSDVQMYHPGEIVDFGVDAGENAFYFSQQYATSAYSYLKSDSMLTKIELVDDVWQRTEYVHLFNHGYGYFGLEKEGEDVYLLTESNGPLTNSGTTVSRVIWENGKMYDEQFGQTWALSELTGSFRPKSDTENGIVAVYVDLGRKSHYAFYDRESLLSGEEAHYLHTVVCESQQEPANGEDDSDGRYNSTIRGYTIHDGYIYQLSGAGKMYLSVFDLEGKLQYCHLVEDYADLAGRTPGSIAFGGDDLYIAVMSTENSELYTANVWKFEEVNNEENSN